MVARVAVNRDLEGPTTRLPGPAVIHPRSDGLPPSPAIAVIDDEDVIRASMNSLIRSLGLEVKSFASADAFLAAEDQRFACVISDVQMPGMSGLELQRVIAGWPDPPPVIIMTAFPERARRPAVQNGAVCFIEKPVDGERLVRCLEAVLGSLD
jgi:FixJ family two-component response regulator